MTPDPDHDPAADAPTVELVPLSDLIDFARVGAKMRRAQRAYFDQRRKAPGVQAGPEYRDARAAEKAFDSAVADVLSRERRTLPGMGG